MLAAAVFMLALVFFIYSAATGLLSRDQRVQASPGRQGERTADPAKPRQSELPSAAAAGSGGFAGMLGARSAVVLDANGDTLYSLAGDERRYPASTTKVLTALLAVENGNLSDSVAVGEEANLPKPGSSIAGLRYGERLTLEQLLHALLIPSGNDAAYVIAAHIGRKIGGDDRMGDEEAIALFVQRMNTRAIELGAEHSHFANPDGYHDEQHYTTAADMARIAQAAMKHSPLRQIVAKASYALPDVRAKDKDGKLTTQRRVLKNTNELLDRASPYYMKSCSGIKTGHTTEAGYCLVSAAIKGGASVLAVVMDSAQESVWEDSSQLLQWGLAQR